MSCMLPTERLRRPPGTPPWLALQKHGEATSSVLGKKGKIDIASKQKATVIVPCLLSEF